MRVAVLGLGEAGSVYAADLATRGAVVTGTDLHVIPTPAGVVRADDVALAVRGADIVLSLVGASSAASVLSDALPAMEAASIFVDMNTSGPGDKLRQAAVAAGFGIRFVDAAIMAPVARARVDTPLLLSGPGVSGLQPTLERFGVPTTDVGEEPGAAARLKLLRSVFMKGLAAVVVESVTAAQIFGAEDWLIDQIAAELGGADRRIVDHLVDGSARHAVRRAEEMIQARSFLETLDAPHPMTDGTIAVLQGLAHERQRGAPDAR